MADEKIVSVLQYETPCWVLRWSDGRDVSDDGNIQHFDSAKEARDAIQPEWPGVAQPFQLPVGCWRVTCPGCLTDLDGDSFSIQHFADEASARWQAGEYDWVPGAGGQLYCGTYCVPVVDDDAA